MENLHGPEGGVPHTGTTIVACVYPGGVVIGADGRVSVGNYISNRASNKITPLTDNVFLLRSGSAPDTQAVADYGMIRRFLCSITSHLLCLLLHATHKQQTRDRSALTWHILAAVRHFAHQLQAESGGELTVDTVANLVRQVGQQLPTTTGWLHPDHSCTLCTSYTHHAHTVRHVMPGPQGSAGMHWPCLAAPLGCTVNMQRMDSCATSAALSLVHDMLLTSYTFSRQPSLSSPCPPCPPPLPRRSTTTTSTWWEP